MKSYLGLFLSIFLLNSCATPNPSSNSNNRLALKKNPTHILVRACSEKGEDVKEHNKKVKYFVSMVKIKCPHLVKGSSGKDILSTKKSKQKPQLQSALTSTDLKTSKGMYEDYFLKASRESCPDGYEVLEKSARPKVFECAHEYMPKSMYVWHIRCLEPKSI